MLVRGDDVMLSRLGEGAILNALIFGFLRREWWTVRPILEPAVFRRVAGDRDAALPVEVLTQQSAGTMPMLITSVPWTGCLHKRRDTRREAS